jgi:hypothetical protein
MGVAGLMPESDAVREMMHKWDLERLAERDSQSRIRLEERQDVERLMSHYVKVRFDLHTSDGHGGLTLVECDTCAALVQPVSGPMRRHVESHG